VGAEDGRDPPVEVPSHRDLLARQLGMEIDDEGVGGAGQGAEQLVDSGEGVALHPQVHLAAQVDDGDPHPGRLDDRVPPARIRCREVGGANDPRLGVQVGIDLAVAVAVVAERDHVGARLEDLGGGLLGDPNAAGHVLPVDHNEVGQPLGPKPGHRRRQPLATGLADDVPYEQEAHPAAA
jgi:hypothetical protein